MLLKPLESNNYQLVKLKYHKLFLRLFLNILKMHKYTKSCVKVKNTIFFKKHTF